MSQFNDSNALSVTLSGSVSLYERVTAVGAQAGVSDLDVGVAKANGASGETIGVSSINKQGTQKMIAAGAIAAGAKVYTAAAGKINDVAATGSFLRGIAMEAASADGDVIEVLPLWGDTASI